MKRYDDSTPRSNGRLSRRNFLKRSSLVPLSSVFGIVPAEASRTEPLVRKSSAATINAAIIGFGQWGREIAAMMGRIPEYNIAAVVDTYDVMLTRAQRSVPDAATYSDYREVLDDPEITTVLIATPTHVHREIAVAALEAGKHVYVEAPMASTIEDAGTMARAARDAEGQIFQVGLLHRSDPQYRNVFQFIRSGALGRPTMARGQWHSKESWRRASPSREREIAQNWRLDAEHSIGLIGEVGIHHLDPAGWFLGSRPTAVTGFGQIMLWDDGREVPDTVQAVFAYPNGVHLIYDATLTSSFDGAYDLFYGRDSTIMLRDSKAWMFKEVDAPMLGWEVYARKDSFYKEKGIALVANATQLDAQNVDPTADVEDPPLFHALKDFADNHTFGPYPPAAGFQEGYEATVVVIKANEAISSGTRIEYDDALFEL